MKEELISFETAKLAKEKGINIDCDENYNEDKKLTHNFSIKPAIYSATTQSLLQRWLREVHNIHVCIEPVIVEKAKSPIKFEYYILYDVDEDGISSECLPFHTYELALEEALLEGLKLIK